MCVPLILWMRFLVDSIHVDPMHLNKYRKGVPGCFDTAIINIAPNNDSGVQDASRQVSNELQVSTKISALGKYGVYLLFHQQPLDFGFQVDFRASIWPMLNGLLPPHGPVD